MLKGRFSQLSNFNQILLSLSLVVGSSFILLFIGSLLCYLFFGINIMTDTNALDINGANPNIPALKFYQAVYSTGMFIIPPFIIAYLISFNVGAYLKINQNAKLSSFFQAFLLILVSLPLINMMGELNSQIHFPDFLNGIEQWMRETEEHAALVTQKFLKMDHLGDLLSNLLLIAVIPALGEELLFRGVLQKQFSKMTGSIHWGIFISAALFSALHMQFFGFFPRLFLGMLFGYLLVWTGSLWVPILAHLVNNGLAVTASYFIGKGQLPQEADSIGSSNLMWETSLISLILFSALVYQLFRTRKRQIES
ncbi:CPBP family intramembrane metalloprotease [Ancylomarina euxinus]|uniref:CPBP family intramembrane metalloprotease n=1 Tax=Ancylomarina euxinus TaxID=2283627 RepID=A0A425Y8F8_9BACT|nr:CPBP family intramembrane glutamic endopeptidase [Ancylomarina euxinus]MCZ4693531.1 CPBP family intramembrane metalloprotease [Ancylomarina euxinus]MUP13758.1 CPBP family intramembrane metalloprotease [Ancylomarina euxinus]RRG24604.1 CPBP family intramembrane metalloprotease [Ancylomarina euxinus]